MENLTYEVFLNKLDTEDYFNELRNPLIHFTYDPLSNKCSGFSFMIEIKLRKEVIPMDI